MNRRVPVGCAAVFLLCLCLVFPVKAAERRVEDMLPSECGPGWTREGPVSSYTRESLYKYIDGEAELYLPYGFERVATALYMQSGSKGDGLVVNLFGMGSSLDAFGIYANYRDPSLERAPVGAEAFVDESQLMFFQDRYFVQVMGSGTAVPDKSRFEACAATIAGGLPGPASYPPEMALIKIDGLVPGTEKYFPENLLGYRFLGRGLTAEMMFKERRVRAFVVMSGSGGGAGRAFDDYVQYLMKSKGQPRVSAAGWGSRLHAVDPLFKGVVLQRVGPHAIGLAGLKEPEDGDKTIDRWAGALAAAPSLP